MKPFVLIIIASSIVFAGAVIFYLGLIYLGYKRERKRRDAECAAKTHPQEVRPLRDDVAENVSSRRFKWLNICDNHYNALLESLRSQLARRPNVWGVGLWPDAETEDIARMCAELIKPFGLPNNLLIPCDPLDLIAAFDGDGVKPILGDIEEKFRFVIDAAWYEKDHTFAELVEYVRAHRNTAPNSVFRERRRYGWGCATMMWLILVANVWWSVESIKAICQCIADKGITFKPILNAVISLLFASLTIYIAYVILVQWFADRCEEKEEHKNATSEGNCHP